jgi:formyltetrahydrofolate deformylase
VAHAGEHIDSGRELFLSRLEWDLDAFDIPTAAFEEHFRAVADAYRIKYHLALSDPRVAILSSSYDHCLADLLYRHSTGELPCTISIVIASDPAARRLAEFHGVPFHLLSDPKNKQASEQEMLDLLGQDVDFIILTRYLQILSPEFVGHYLLRLINIHHSFLPGFVGAKPYHKAFEREVKLIGATSHYVLVWMRVPIIQQDIVVRVSHRDTVDDMIRKGRDLEKLCFRVPCVGIWKTAFWCTRTKRLFFV